MKPSQHHISLHDDKPLLMRTLCQRNHAAAPKTKPQYGHATPLVGFLSSGDVLIGRLFCGAYPAPAVA
jgi:hypothetical protein